MSGPSGDGSDVVSGGFALWTDRDSAPNGGVSSGMAVGRVVDWSAVVLAAGDGVAGVTGVDANEEGALEAVGLDAGDGAFDVFGVVNTASCAADDNGT